MYKYMKRWLTTPQLEMGRVYMSNLAETVNGVELPRNVVLELQKLGLSLSWYTKDQLERSVLACAVDNKLVDDPQGVNFDDKLELTNEEISFRERLEKERENAVSTDGIATEQP